MAGYRGRENLASKPPSVHTLRVGIRNCQCRCQDWGLRFKKGTGKISAKASLGTMVVVHIYDPHLGKGQELTS